MPAVNAHRYRKPKDLINWLRKRGKNHLHPHCPECGADLMTKNSIRGNRRVYGYSSLTGWGYQNGGNCWGTLRLEHRYAMKGKQWGYNPTGYAVPNSNRFHPDHGRWFCSKCNADLQDKGVIR